MKQFIEQTMISVLYLSGNERSYRADHDDNPSKFVDGIFSINEVTHSMDSRFLNQESCNKRKNII